MFLTLLQTSQNPSLDAQIRLEIMQRAKQGNVSDVMTQYEREVQHPVRSLVFGHLLQLILIQSTPRLALCLAFFLHILAF